MFLLCIEDIDMRYFRLEYFPCWIIINQIYVMVHDLVTFHLIWNKLISLRILIIIMQMSILAADERTGSMNIINFFGINKCYGEWYMRLNYFFS